MDKLTDIDRTLIEYARAVAEVEEKEPMTHSMMRKEWGELLIKVKQDLSKLGVVRKVDRELPENPIKVTAHLGLSLDEALTKQAENDCLVLTIQDQMLLAGYVAVEEI